MSQAGDRYDTRGESLRAGLQDRGEDVLDEQEMAQVAALELYFIRAGRGGGVLQRVD